MENNKRAEWGALSTGKPSPGGAEPNKAGANSVILQPDEAMEADLNSFFPFDPYKLPSSQSYVDPVYREWKSVALDNDGEESDDEDDDVDVVEEAEEEALVGSLNEMSISPIRRLAVVV